MSYAAESEMYPEVREWLNRYLSSRFKDAEVEVHDTHANDLKAVVNRLGLQRYFPDQSWQAYEIKVDITGFLMKSNQPQLVFVECKNRPVSLLHLAQLLGYCRIARPTRAFLLSPFGPGDALRSLVLRYDRPDILEYEWPKGSLPRTVIVAKWDQKSLAVDPSSVLPPGVSL